MIEEAGRVIVITGSTRGIGYGLADAFLGYGCRVVICGRTQESTDHAVVQLAEQHDPERVYGKPCDVRLYPQVEALWEAAVKRYGAIDIWINNAGVGTGQLLLWEHPPDEMASLYETNVLGTLHGIKVAMQGMLVQGHGALYNMEGLGSDGRRVTGLTLYGSTKRAVRYLTAGLVAETKRTSILVGSLLPGMVVTDLLVERFDRDSVAWEETRRILNILADRVETVAPWMARRVLENTRHGATIRWLTPTKLLWRFLSAPFRRREIVT